MARMLNARGAEVIVLDSLEYGFRAAISDKAKLFVGSVGDRKLLDRIFGNTRFDAVMHFAGYISVAESVQKPQVYFSTNVVSPHALLEAMEYHNVTTMIFSSSAAVYGNPEKVPIPEDHAKNPTNPYGLTKLCFEELLAFYDRKGTIRSVSLRYFNAAGASRDGQYGEAHNPETHIIPSAIHAAQKKETFFLFGTNYKTRDGTCERDYIHVEDLCDAHVVALDALLNGHKTDVFNVGTGIGVTNSEVIQHIRTATGADIKVIKAAPRPGDVPILVADPVKLKREFGWEPKHSDIETIVKTAWKWHEKHSDGYGRNIKYQKSNIKN
jgi:UDP-glucose 4-epimerase